MDLRRWWWLAGTALALSACAAAAVTPRLAPLADGVMIASGLVCAVVTWAYGGRHQRGLRGWRLIALSPLFPVLGGVLSAVLAPTDPVDAAVLRWLPTVPGYLLAIVGGLTLVDRARFRDRGRRVGVELALFTTASMVTVQLLFVGPAGRWGDFGAGERLVLTAGVVVTSATMAAALTVLGVIESRRQRVALLLFAGSVLLTAGRALATSAELGGWAGGTALSRLGIAAGLAAVTVAALVDPGPGSGSRPRTGASTRLGQLLPHLALVVATVVLAAATLAGHRPSALSAAGMVLAVALVAAHRWLTAREEQLLGARLRRSEAWFRSLVQSGSDAVVILDDDLRVTWASPALSRTLGPVADALLGQALPAVVHSDDVPGLLAALPAGEPGKGAPAAHAHDGGTHLVRLPDADGGWRIFEANISDLRDDPSVGAVVLHCRDITDRHAREEALQSVAYSDPITGLPNRPAFLLDLQRALEPGGRPATLLLVEVEGLLKAREDVGREIVRNVVGEIGRRLRSTVRGDDIVARMGSGTFAVLTHGTDTDDPAAEADQVASRCLAVVEQPIMTVDGIVDLTASVGLAAAEPGLSVEDLLNRVGLAVRAARERAAGTAARYTPELGEAAARRDRLRADLAAACDRGELFLLFEPIVSLGEQRVVGVEALLRWRHPVYGDVAPEEFMPLAARAGVVGQLGSWALQEATTAVAALSPESGAEPLRLGFDVSTPWAGAGTLVADVEAALRASGLPAERLILEITESTVLADDERIGLDLATLRLMGVHVALEGFGTGYSGLTQLTQLPIDVLKLDRSLISRVDRDPQSRALCESVAGIGRALGLDVVAEGVETPAQLGALCGSACGFAQGFVISRPMTASDLGRLIAKGAGSLWPGLVGQR